jgi:hypothetical protein
MENTAKNTAGNAARAAEEEFIQRSFDLLVKKLSAGQRKQYRSLDRLARKKRLYSAIAGGFDPANMEKEAKG